MRTFCEFWVDVRPTVGCCQFADDETITTDPEVFDCDGCVVRLAQAELAPENAEVWQMFQRLTTRFVFDAGLAGEAFRRLTGDWPDEQAAEAMDRLGVIYDVVYPPQQKGSS